MDIVSQSVPGRFDFIFMDIIDAGMNAHIAKPIDSKKIEDTLQLVLKTENTVRQFQFPEKEEK